MNDRNDRENKAERARRKKFLNPFRRLFYELSEINCKLERIMATDAEHAQALRDLKTQLEKVNAEISRKLTELEQALANQGNVSQEVTDALDAVKGLVQAADDKIEDLTS